MKISGQEALTIAHKNKLARDYPSKLDPRYNLGLIYPSLEPRFFIPQNCTIFTIGSCFARNIEEKLQGFSLPTRSFSVPKTEWPNRPNGLLNEYNPGTICQRIAWALTGKSFDKSGVIEEGAGYVDLLLPACTPVTEERIFQRRNDIDSVYKFLLASDVVIITLGLIEAWYDCRSSLYINRMPPAQAIKREPDRFELHILDYDESYSLIELAISKLIASGCRKIILTISPVPLRTTFSGKDCVIANSFSKSVLRVCAERLYRKYTEVDYFPSYEMVISRGQDAYVGDNIHVKDEVVGSVTDYMIKRFIASG